MKKMFGLLSRSWWAFILTVVLLVVQAYCELTLPEYTSKIVNVGIQQAGVDSPVPETIRAESLYSLILMMSEGEAMFTLSCYEGESGAELTPGNLAPEGILTLKEFAGDEKAKVTARLEENLVLPMVLNFFISNITAGSALSGDLADAAGSFGIGDAAGFFNEDGSPNMAVLSDPAAMGLLFEELGKLDSTITNQIAIGYVTGEYREIGIDIEKKQNDYMMANGLTMVVYAFAAMLSTIGVSYLSSRVGSLFARDLRNAIFKKVMKFSNREYDSFSTASLITRSTNDIQQVQMVIIMLLRMMIYAPIVGVGAFSKVQSQNSSLSWVIGVAVGALLLLVIFLFIVALPKFQIIQKLIDRLNLVSREILTGLPVIRAFATENKEKKRFDEANIDLTKVNIFVNRIMSIMFPTMMFIMNGVTVLIIWAGAGAVDAGAMQVGDLMAFISYTMQIIMAFLILSMMSIILPRAIIAMRRIGEVLSKDIKITDPINPAAFDGKTMGTLEFRNVCFRYENAEEDVLRNISFMSGPGETTAIIGSTGSGKSTLANLIPRFFEITAGEILVDGLDIRNVTLRDLRDKIGYVPQKAVLFSGTVKSNISYASMEEMPEEEIKRAADIAQASGFIEDMEEGYDSEISQGGSNVSGGQKQRLSIARAIAKKPEIYIFDDSFSALDYKTDIALRRELAKAISGKSSTVLIVTQRISTVLRADQIIVLDDGAVAGIGKHADLLHTCEVYRDIAYSQLSAEEIEGKEEA